MLCEFILAQQFKKCNLFLVLIQAQNRLHSSSQVFFLQVRCTAKHKFVMPHAASQHDMNLLEHPVYQSNFTNMGS